jgi:hypothetical protein
MRRTKWTLMNAVLATAIFGALTIPAQLPAGAATPPQLSLNVLLIGTGSSDPTTAAWQSALTSEGVAFTEVTAIGAIGAETVTLPALTTGTAGNFNGVVIADSPFYFAAGQLTALDSYESSFQVRQIDGYSYPSPLIGQTDVSGGTLNGTTATVTTAGLLGMPQLKGTIPFDTGTYGYAATADAGAPFTPWITNAAGQVLAGVYQHPSTDPQAGVSELSLNFDYGSSFLQWLVLAPGLINWVTQDSHLGLYRNYFGQDVDDNFISDNEWSSTYQCTPAATDPSDVTCPAGVANNPADTPLDVQMNAADVAYVVAWEQSTGIKLNLAFNGVGACTAPLAIEESSAICTGSVTDNGVTYSLPGQQVDSSYPNDAALINALLQYKADFNWVIHTWSHEYLGCTAFQPQAVTSVTANASGGTFSAGTYSYEVTAATAYGESEPSLPLSATVAANGSITLSWPNATNGSGTTGTVSAGLAGPTLAQEEAIHTGGTGFWGYNIYRATGPAATATNYGLVGQVAENGTQATYAFTDTGAAAGGAPGSSDANPTVTNPGIDCSSIANSWLPANDPAGTTDASIDTEIAWDQAWATANNLPNYSPSVVVTGEHSGIESPNMPAALANVGVTTFASDASRQPTQYSLTSGANVAESAPRYPSNIYYNAANWADELNEYNTLYVAPGVSLGASEPAGTTETGHCDASSATTCLTTPATEATVLASESRIMLSHVLANDPRVGFAHQTDLINDGSGAVGTPDQSGYTLLSLLNSMLAQYNSWSSTPLIQMTDATDAQVLGQQSAWASALAGGKVSATEVNGVVTITNTGSPVQIPVTVPFGTTVSGAAFGQAYGGALSGWTNVAALPLTLNESGAPQIISANSASSIVGAAFTTTVTATGAPTPVLTEAGALPLGVNFTNNGNGTATIAGTAAAGTGGSYAITITAASTAGTATQTFTLTNSQAPTITSAATTSFTVGLVSTYTVTTTGYPAPTITQSGTLPSGLLFSSSVAGTATITGKPATGTAGLYPVTISATNSSGSTATLPLVITVNASSAPLFTSATSAFFTLSKAGSFAVTTTGSPNATLSEVGTPPAGLQFVPNATGGALISGTPTATGTITLALTAVNGITPNATQTLSIVVGQAPAFSSATSDTVSSGTAFSFPVTTTGYPAASLGYSGTLPIGVNFVAGSNGTGTLSGSATVTVTTSYPITFTAVNGTATTTQAFTLTISSGAAPLFTSAASASGTTGKAFSFAVATTGTPAATLTETGTLPKGLTFKGTTTGTATITGTPTVGGVTTLTLSAKNTSGTTTQTFTLTIAQAPAITSSALLLPTVNKAYNFTVTTNGYPAPTLTESGTLPAGLTFTANTNGTATISGTIKNSVLSVFKITATNATGTSTQTVLILGLGGGGFFGFL